MHNSMIGSRTSRPRRNCVNGMDTTLKSFRSSHVATAGNWIQMPAKKHSNILLQIAGKGAITLLTASKDVDKSQAHVLADLLADSR